MNGAKLTTEIMAKYILCTLGRRAFSERYKLDRKDRCWLREVRMLV